MLVRSRAPAPAPSPVVREAEIGRRTAAIVVAPSSPRIDGRQRTSTRDDRGKRHRHAKSTRLQSSAALRYLYAVFALARRIFPPNPASSPMSTVASAGAVNVLYLGGNSSRGHVVFNRGKSFNVSIIPLYLEIIMLADRVALYNTRYFFFCPLMITFVPPFQSFFTYSLSFQLPLYTPFYLGTWGPNICNYFAGTFMQKK